MKRVLLATVGLMALVAAQPAAAADLPSRMAVKAPVMAAPIVYNWTGLYVGGHIGYAASSRDWWDPTFLASSHDADGFIGGGQVGFNWQAGRWVFGVEGDMSWADLNGSGLCGVALAFSCRNNIDWLATLTGRVGYTWDRTLLYVKGGAAWANENSRINTAPAGTFVASTGDDTRSGWTVGVGLEYAFWNNWSAKVEYNYMDFGSDNSNFRTAAGAPYGAFTIDQQVHAVKLGVNYRFGWGGPVVARY